MELALGRGTPARIPPIANANNGCFANVVIMSLLSCENVVLPVLERFVVDFYAKTGPLFASSESESKLERDSVPYIRCRMLLSLHEALQLLRDGKKGTVADLNRAAKMFRKHAMKLFNKTIEGSSSRSQWKWGDVGSAGDVWDQVTDALVLLAPSLFETTIVFGFECMKKRCQSKWTHPGPGDASGHPAGRRTGTFSQVFVVPHDEFSVREASSPPGDTKFGLAPLVSYVLTKNAKPRHRACSRCRTAASATVKHTAWPSLLLVRLSEGPFIEDLRLDETLTLSAVSRSEIEKSTTFFHGDTPPLSHSKRRLGAHGRRSLPDWVRADYEPCAVVYRGSLGSKKTGSVIGHFVASVRTPTGWVLFNDISRTTIQNLGTDTPPLIVNRSGFRGAAVSILLRRRTRDSPYYTSDAKRTRPSV
jgi:hypothetical protein